MTNRIATIISNVFDPMPTTVFIGLLGIFLTPMSQGTRLFWLGLVGAMGALVAGFLAWFIRRGYVFDARLTHGDDLHRDRLGILWIANGLLVVAVAVAGWYGRPEPLWTILVAMTVVLIVATMVTSQFKVSLHMVGAASLVTLLLIQFHGMGAVALVLLPLVAWARRALHRHTPAQLLAGTLIPAVLIPLVFILTGQL